MRITVTLSLSLSVIWALVSATSARADPFVFPTSVVTSGAFDCRSTIVCSGEGTSAITFGSGASTATLSFTGVSTTFDVTNQSQPVTLGHFELTASDGFLFPTHPANPRLPVLRFLLSIDHTAPTVDRAVNVWQFGPGGRPVLTLQQGTGHTGLDNAANPFGYTMIVYTFRPFPFTINPNEITALTAEVAAVPEPATLLLLGTGLVGAACARRRRRLTGPA